MSFKTKRSRDLSVLRGCNK